eukprot:jgi/Mesvir1/2293/Mv19330-RA.1
MGRGSRHQTIKEVLARHANSSAHAGEAENSLRRTSGRVDACPTPSLSALRTAFTPRFHNSIKNAPCGQSVVKPCTPIGGDPIPAEQPCATSSVTRKASHTDRTTVPLQNGWEAMPPNAARGSHKATPSCQQRHLVGAHASNHHNASNSLDASSGKNASGDHAADADATALAQLLRVKRSFGQVVPSSGQSTGPGQPCQSGQSESSSRLGQLRAGERPGVATLGGAPQHRHKQARSAHTPAQESPRVFLLADDTAPVKPWGADDSFTVQHPIFCRLPSGGDDGRVLGWSWRALEAAMAPGTQAARRPVPATFQVNLPQQRGVGGALGPVAEVNDLACDAKQARVFAAAGDGNAYAWDMGAGRLVASFSGGHSDMLHCIALRPAHHQAVTGSEDGTCCVWDVRSGSHTKLLDLSRTSVQALPCFRGTASGGVPAAGGGATVTSRVGDAGVAAATRATPQGAHWVGAMATDTSQDWLFLGAGSSSSAGGALITCSMHAMAPVTAIATDAPVHALAFGHDQQVITGGAGPLLHAYGGINLAHQHSWKTSSSSLFAVAEHSSKLVAVGGRGGFVDIFTDYGSVMATFQCS